MKTKPKTKMQMRVAIMRDVIEQVKLKKFVAKSGVYLELAGDYAGRQPQWSALHYTALTQGTLTDKRAPKCRVCALGAAFLSAVRLDNKFEGNFIVQSYTMRDRLTEYFSYEELLQFEALFEGSYGASPKPGPHPSIRLRRKFLTGFAQLPDDVRLVFICRQIIRQRGGLNERVIMRRATDFAPAWLKRSGSAALLEAFETKMKSPWSCARDTGRASNCG